MIDWKMHVIDLGIESKTDAEIGVILSGLTKGPIDVGKAKFWLKQQGLLLRSQIDPSQTSGALWTVYSDVNTPAELKAGLAEFFEHVLDPTSRTIATNTVEWAAKAEGLLSTLEAAGVITSAQHEAFHDLDGGLVYSGGVTTADVTAARAAYAVHLNKVALETWFTETFWNPVLAGIQDGTHANQAAINAAVIVLAGG